ncbi:MAG: hypothetical protein H6635_08195 [Anaerolineales bacterium]|nr:hypothetical protein [Anaerolineales bacterium]MCB9145334.1 hypothetical protein [Anaerolineales bacterium]
MIKGINPRDFDQRTQQIKVQASTILTKWGLIPRFKRWRLTQDPETGMVVLFGILNNKYIAEHALISFSKYFDPGLLHDLANELQVQVVSCNSDGLRYAFILDRGRFGKLPTHIDYPFVDNGKLMVRVVFGDDQQSAQIPPGDTAIMNDNRFMRQVAGAFLKIFEDIKLRDDVTLLLSAQNPPDIAIIDEVEFNKRVAEHEINRLKVKRIEEFFNERHE